MNKDAITIEPLLLPANVTLTMPGSKSHANRAIICACLSKGKTIIENATSCDDVALLVKNLQKMEYKIEWMDRLKDTLEIHGGVPAVSVKASVMVKHASPQPVSLNCGNAGTTLRFLTALACITPGNWIITGNERMQKRPIKDLTDALRQLGAKIEDSNGCPPIRIQGGNLDSESVMIDASKSSQYLTALMLIEPALKNPITIKLKNKLASSSYIDLTKKVQRDFGVAKKGDRYHSPKKYTIEGDWSAAGAWLVLEALTRSKIQFTNLDPHSKQSDAALPSVIKSMQQKGNLTIDCTQIPDQMMNLAVLAAFRNGTTKLIGIKNLRIKECDRIAVTVSELKKAGIKIKEDDHAVIIKGQAIVRAKHASPQHASPQHASPQFDTHNDHRMAMAFSILGLLKPKITVDDPQCVSKSYPAFFSDLKKLYRFPRCISIIGMRAIGKTSLAKKLASKLKLKAIDTDKIFVNKYGTIDNYVKKHGWKAFRKQEEEIVAASLQSGHIVSLGGGAIESAKTRKVLQEKSVVIWMQADAKTIINRLKKTHRPALTEKPMDLEVREVLQKRNPLFKEVAQILLPDHTPFSKQIFQIVSLLQSVFPTSTEPRSASRTFSISSPKIS